MEARPVKNGAQSKAEATRTEEIKMSEELTVEEQVAADAEYYILVADLYAEAYLGA